MDILRGDFTQTDYISKVLFFSQHLEKCSVETLY